MLTRMCRAACLPGRIRDHVAALRKLRHWGLHVTLSTQNGVVRHVARVVWLVQRWGARSAQLGPDQAWMGAAACTACWQQLLCDRLALCTRCEQQQQPPSEAVSCAASCVCSQSACPAFALHVGRKLGGALGELRPVLECLLREDRARQHGHIQSILLSHGMVHEHGPLTRIVLGVREPRGHTDASVSHCHVTVASMEAWPVLVGASSIWGAAH